MKDKIIEILKEEMGDRFDLSWAVSVANRIRHEQLLSEHDNSLIQSNIPLPEQDKPTGMSVEDVQLIQKWID